MKKLSILVMILVAFFQGYAQNTTKTLNYIVKVVNAEGELLPNAEITYQNDKDKSLVKGFTNDQGQGTFSLVQGETYSLKIVQAGVTYSMQNVTVPIGNYADANMTYTIIPPRKAIVPEDNGPKKLTYFVQVTNFDGVPEANAKVSYENVSDKKVLEGTTDAEGKVEIALMQGQSYIPKVHQYDTIFVLDKIDAPVGNFAGVNMTYQIRFVQKYTNIYQINIEFNSNDYSLGKGSIEILDKLAASLQTTSHKFELAAHTDNVGSDAANMLLSQKRANSVRDYLIKKGIAANRLIAKGYGEKAPIADNGTSEGRAKNRRTEVRQIEKRPK